MIAEQHNALNNIKISAVMGKIGLDFYGYKIISQMVYPLCREEKEERSTRQVLLIALVNNVPNIQKISLTTACVFPVSTQIDKYILLK